jgi:multicomponent Na+:H+ antiporter subunit G
VIEIVVIVLAAIGWAFSLSGAVGILRMPDVYTRIQCSSKMITMGALPVLIALVVGEGAISVFGSRALLVAVLLLVINPVASHALARAAYKTRVPMWVLDYLLIALMLASAVLVVRLRNLNGAVMALSGVGTMLSVLFVALGAPDVAHSEVVVGAIALPVLYLVAIGKARAVTGEPGLGETEGQHEDQQ